MSMPCDLATCGAWVLMMSPTHTRTVEGGTPNFAARSLRPCGVWVWRRRSAVFVIPAEFNFWAWDGLTPLTWEMLGQLIGVPAEEPDGAEGAGVPEPPR